MISTITKGLKNNHGGGSSESGGMYYKQKPDSIVEVVFLDELEEMFQLEQVFFSHNGIQTSWVFLGDDDPSGYLKYTKKTFRVVCPIMVKINGNWEGPKLWMQSATFRDELVSECEMEGIEANERVFKVRRNGSGLDTTYKIKATKTPAKDEVDFAEHSDFNPLEPLGPFSAEELFEERLEERFGMNRDAIIEKYGDVKKAKKLLSQSEQNPFEDNEDEWEDFE